jgi:hypothetical protein
MKKITIFILLISIVISCKKNNEIKNFENESMKYEKEIKMKIPDSVIYNIANKAIKDFKIYNMYIQKPFVNLSESISKFPYNDLMKNYTNEDLELIKKQYLYRNYFSWNEKKLNGIDLVSIKERSYSNDNFYKHKDEINRHFDNVKEVEMPLVNLKTNSALINISGTYYLYEKNAQKKWILKDSLK